MNTYAAIVINVIKHHGLDLVLADLSPTAEAKRMEAAFDVSLATIKRGISKLKTDARVQAMLEHDAVSIEDAQIALAETGDKVYTPIALALGDLMWEAYEQPEGAGFPEADEDELTLAQVLTVAADGNTFTVNGDEPVDISRRTAMKRILRAVAEDGPLTTDELIAAGWDEEVTDDNARKLGKRLYEALFQLRMLGLEGILVKVEKGVFGISDEYTVHVK